MSGPTVIEALDQALSRHARREAIVAGERRYRYSDLDLLSGRVAGHLARAGVLPGQIVGMTGPRSAEQVVTLVGIVRAGAGVCFLDTANPDQWNRDIVARTGMALLISDERPAFAEHLPVLHPEALLAAGGRAPAPAGVDGQSCAYVNFSSGTTGAPKVIACTHQGLLGFCLAPRHLPVTMETRMLYSAPLTFDASQMEIWLPLLNGGCVVVNEEALLEAGTLRSLVRGGAVNAIWLTSALLHTFVEIDPACLAGIDWLLTGGDVLSPQHVVDAYAVNPGLTLYHCYGPTETTIINCLLPVPRPVDAAQPLALGYPVHAGTLHVLREDGGVCDEGEVGELVVTGGGLALGYLGDAARTALKFPTLSIGGRLRRCYRTDDLVSRDGDGMLWFHGRRDDQVKIRGNRVVPAEVALAYAAYPGIGECVVIAHGAPSTALAMFYTGRDAEIDDDAVLRRFGRARLPEFMVPARFIRLDRMPLRANGKRDDAALRASLTRHGVEAGPAVAGPGACVGLPHLRMDDNFFEAGGDSLGAIRLVGLVNRLFGADCLSLVEFYGEPTLRRALARVPASALPRDGAPACHVVPLSGREGLERAEACLPVTTVRLAGGRFALVPAPSREAAEAFVRRHAGDDTARPDLMRVGLNKAQLSMLYAELFHGDLTMNNVAYVLSAAVGADAGAKLPAIAAALVRAYPLSGSMVVEVDGDYCFELAPQCAGPAAAGEAPAFSHSAACIDYLLAVPLSLFEGTLLRLFSCVIGGERRVAVLFHHILGDQRGQFELLNFIAERLAGLTAARPPLPSLGFVTNNLALAAEDELRGDACVAYWRAYGAGLAAGGGAPYPNTATDANHVVLRCRVPGLALGNAHRYGELLKFFRRCVEQVLGIADPWTYVLMSRRDGDDGAGFCTYVVPVRLNGAEFGDGAEPMLATRRLLDSRDHCVVGTEEILSAIGLHGRDIHLIFNLVERSAAETDWLAANVIDVHSELPKADLDLTVIRTGEQVELVAASRFEPSLARRLTSAYAAALGAAT